jgi:putative addiction module killer protein
MSSIAVQIRALTAEAKVTGQFDPQRLYDLYERVGRNGAINEAVLSERIARGDLTAIDATIPIIGRDAAERRTNWSSKLLTPEFAQRNFDLCVPLVRALLSGDSDARAQYEQNRLLLWESLPVWARHGIETNIRSNIPPLVVKFRSLPLEVQHAVPRGRDTRLTLNPPMVIEPLRQVGFTYSSARAILDAAQAGREFGTNVPSLYVSTLIANLTPREALKGPRAFYFDPTPVGDYLAGALSRAVDLCLSARVLEDVRAVLELNVDDHYLERALMSAGGEPWSIMEIGRVRKAVEVGELCANQPALRQYMGALLIANEPKRAAERLLTAQSADAVTDVPEPKQGEDCKEPEHRAGEDFAAICAVLRARSDLDDDQLIVEARRFAALLRKGVCAYSEFLAALEHGASLSEVSAKLRASRRMAALDDRDAINPVLLESDPRRGESIADLTHRKVSITATAQREIERRGYTLRRRIEARIERFLCTGSVGDAEKLTSARDLYAMRIDVGQGIRVYYSMLAECSLLVCWVGDKKDQWRDVQRASGELRLSSEAAKLSYF